jgi:DNA-binding response OmpR family regulator
VANVLIVEDNRDLAALVATTLRMEGHDVRTADDGAEALLLAAERGPDVIVLDVGLPKLDGVELARALRQMHGRDVRLIAYTGSLDDALLDRLFDAGVDDAFRKPVPMPRLAAAVRDHERPTR